jgi:hypothetical protein
MDEKREQQIRARKIRTGWILATIAVAFFVGIIVRHWLT